MFMTSEWYAVDCCACTEETSVNEYAALCLASMGKYYSCKRQICEHKGVEQLIRGLSSADPDLQKNCIEVISLVLEVSSA